MEGKVTMGSHAKEPSHGTVVDNLSGRSTPKQKSPIATQAPDIDPASAFQSFMQKFAKSAIEAAAKQSRYETLQRDQQQQRDEQSRWTRYQENFTSFGEDQSRNAKALQKRLTQLEQQRNEVKIKSEEALHDAAQIIFTTRTDNSLQASQIDAKLENFEQRLCSQAQEIDSLKKENSSLREAAAESNSQHQYIKEILNTQERHTEELSELSTNTKTLSNSQVATFDSMRSEFRVVNEKFKEEIRDKCIDKDTLARLNDLEKDSKLLKRDTQSLKASRAESSGMLQDLSDRVDLNFRTSSEQEATITKFEQRFTDSDSKNNKAAQEISEKLRSTTEGYMKGNQTLQNEIQALRVRFDAIEQTLNDKDDNQSSTINNQQIWDEQQILKTRVDSISQTLDEHRRRNAQASEAKTSSETPYAQSNLLGLTDHVKQEIDQYLQQVDQKFANQKDSEDQRDKLVGEEIDKINEAREEAKKELDEKFKEQGTTIADQQNQLVEIRATLSSTSNSLETAKTDIIHLQQANSDGSTIEHRLSELQANITRIQHQLNSNAQEAAQPSPPLSTCGMKDDVHSRLENLDSKIKAIENGFRAIESFQATHETRWNNLTTESLVKGVVYNIQQLYPLPMLQFRQNQLDSRLTQLIDSNNQKHEAHNLKSDKIEQAIREIRESQQNSTLKVNEIEKTARENTESLDASKKTVKGIEDQISTLSKSIHDLGEDSEHAKLQNNARVRTETLSAIQGFKENLETFDTRYGSVTADIQSLRNGQSEMNAKFVSELQLSSAIQLIQEKLDKLEEKLNRSSRESKDSVDKISTAMNGEVLSLRTQFSECKGDLDNWKEEFDKFWEQSKKEFVNVDLKVDKLQTKVDELGTQKLRDSKSHDKITGTKKQPLTLEDNSDSDMPLKRRNQRSPPPPDSNPITPQKRKKASHLAGEDSNNEEASVSSQPVRKSARKSSQPRLDWGRRLKATSDYH